MFFLVQLHLKSVIDIDATDCNEISYLLHLFSPRKLVTGNAQVDQGSMSNFSTLTTAGGQFESLQGV